MLVRVLREEEKKHFRLLGMNTVTFRNFNIVLDAASLKSLEYMPALAICLTNVALFSWFVGAEVQKPIRLQMKVIDDKLTVSLKTCIHSSSRSTLQKR